MKKQSLVLVSLSLGLMCFEAQALNLKAVAFTAEEIVNLFKRGGASVGSLIEAQFFQSKATQHALLASVKRAGKGEMHILVSQEKGEGMDVLKVHLVSPLDQTVKKSVDELSATDLMHGEMGVVARKALIESGLRQEGLRIKEELVNSNLVTLAQETIYSVMKKIKSVRESGMIVQQPGIILDTRRPVAGSIESLDLAYIKNLADAGPAASFEIRLGISDTTTPEQLRRVMQIIVDSAEKAL